jgi:hypothetical protein
MKKYHKNSLIFIGNSVEIVSHQNKINGEVIIVRLFSFEFQKLRN